MMKKTLTTLTSLLLLSGLSLAQQLNRYVAPVSGESIPSTSVIRVDPWTASKVQHAYGLPETKAKAKGTMAISDAGLVFTSSASRYTIPWANIAAVSNGVERVEMWGTTGRLVRMAIPNGGGLAAAGVMHHKVNELTVEFRDQRGSYHGAVFFLPGKDATRVLDIYTHAIQPAQQHPDLGIAPSVSALACQAGSGSHSVLVSAPVWNEAQVPAAYRAMVYEHIVDRMQRVQGVGHVFRDGETGVQPVCPQYTVTISIVSYKPGNQVKRAMMGPVGFFVGTTQMVFNITIRDASGGLNSTQEVQATLRGEGESKNVTDGVAKKIAKSYANTTKQFEQTPLTARANSPLPH
jgi:hypothetical protein